MSSRQNGGGVARLAILIAIGLVIYTTISHRRDQSVQPTRSSPPAAITPAQANTLDAALRLTNTGERKDGVAAIILVDVSGSMAEKVTDAGGGRSPKIEIARRAVQKLVTQTATFAKAHPDQNVQLGIYEFSSRNGQPPCREVVALGAPDPDRVSTRLATMKPEGGTPIGDAIVDVKHKLDSAGLRRTHILVVTDGENNKGYAPSDVVAAMGRLPDASRASVYFVAFDVAAETFKPVRDAGAMVMPAANEAELQGTLDFVLTGKILVEEPTAPAH